MNEDSKRLGYRNVASDPRRTKAVLMPPWRVQPIDGIISEIVSNDGCHLVGHITADCQIEFLEMQCLAHMMKGPIHLGLNEDVVLVGASLKTKQQLRKLIYALEKQESFLPDQIGEVPQ